MRRVIALLIVSVAALPAAALGAMLFVLSDHRDSFQSVRVAQMYPDVAEQVKALEDFLTNVVPKTLPEVERALGRSAGGEVDSMYAMPICQRRTVLLSGLGIGRRRAHHEFYPIDDVGGLQVWYLRDSTTVGATVAYVEVDSRFLPYTRETQNQLGTRLQWDQQHLVDLEQAVRRKFGR